MNILKLVITRSKVDCSWPCAGYIDKTNTFPRKWPEKRGYLHRVQLTRFTHAYNRYLPWCEHLYRCSWDSAALFCYIFVEFRSVFTQALLTLCILSVQNVEDHHHVQNHLQWCRNPCYTSPIFWSSLQLSWWPTLVIVTLSKKIYLLCVVRPRRGFKKTIWMTLFSRIIGMMTCKSPRCNRLVYQWLGDKCTGNRCHQSVYRTGDLKCFLIFTNTLLRIHLRIYEGAHLNGTWKDVVTINDACKTPVMVLLSPCYCYNTFMTLWRRYNGNEDGIYYNIYLQGGNENFTWLGLYYSG
jgi:hypothetical protein